ncbi:hypothetical protein RJ639_022414 [Escallonia herrerae]|uniref:B box-type domain-containing protein n=1 Tax=Escallonia herrerae TaxID=1293975 RepID=A0AA88V622_9ASTE|nr:hypothetical protein RJ639_022414 [Escallonia herrerae]
MIGSKDEPVLGDELEWLGAFLKRTFFDACPMHEVRNNEQNRYCINCKLPACRYCLSAGYHAGHDALKIYRHVYKDVVPLSQMENQIDCSKIQPYKCNKKWVVSMKPLPHCGSGSLMHSDGSCNICKRRLNDPGLYRYCSIACKVEAFSRKMDHSKPPFLAIGNPPQFDAGTKMHRRKGIPHRAPLL